MKIANKRDAGLVIFYPANARRGARGQVEAMLLLAANSAFERDSVAGGQSSFTEPLNVGRLPENVEGRWLRLLDRLCRRRRWLAVATMTSSK